MRKEKTVKTLSLLLMMFVLGTALIGCANNEDVISDTNSKSEIFQTAQNESAQSSSMENIISSDAAIKDSSQDETSSEINQLQNSSLQKPESEETDSVQSFYNSSSSHTLEQQHIHDWNTLTVSASCLGQGYIKKSCYCGESHTTTLEAAGHKWSGWKTMEEPTVSSEGKRVNTCSVCGAESMQSIDKLASSVGESDAHKEVFRLVNEERRKQGLGELTYYSAGQAAADLRAAEIKSVFSHDRPDGRSCFTVFDDFSLDAFMCGENIAWGQRSAQEVVNSWMNSDGHRKNILNPNATGIVVGAKDYRWVQLFVIG